MIKVNKLIFFFVLRYFLREIENMFSVFLSSYRNTHESWRELEKAVETQVIFLFNIIYLIAAIFDNFDMNKIITLFHF